MFTKVVLPVTLKRMIFINFKTYKETTGVKAVDLVRVCSLLQAETKVAIIPCVQATDIRSCMIASNYNIWAQNIDSVEQGQFTGWVSPEAAAEAGAVGTLLNHSEHKIPLKDLKKILERASSVALDTLVFVSDMEELKTVVSLKPTYVAYEPPELIGSKETSVAKAKPMVISEALEITTKANVPLVVGAGVKDANDVKTSIKLGAIGIAVSSAVVLAEDPKKAILELVKGFK